MPENTGLSFFQNLALYFSVAIAWFGGDAGRVFVAAGMGGFVRWLTSERRRIRDGILAIAGGAVAGRYMWPVVLWTLGMEPTPDHIAMAAFIAGTLGISFVKITTAVVETRARKHMEE